MTIVNFAGGSCGLGVKRDTFAQFAERKTDMEIVLISIGLLIGFIGGLMLVFMHKE